WLSPATARLKFASSSTCRRSTFSRADAETLTKGARLRKKLRTKKNPGSIARSGVEKNPGSDLLSHTDYRAVPSALECLTSEFGMGSGGTTPVLPPETL